MKVLHICEYMPLEGLKRENDFAIKMQQEVNKIDNTIEFVFLKGVPYSNLLLSKLKPIWEKYFEYIQKKETTVKGYRTIIYPWIRFPIKSRYKVDESLLLLNRIWNLRKIEKLLKGEIETFDLILSQNNIADGVIANYISNKYNIPYIHVLRGELDEKIYNTKIIKNIIKDAKICITPSPTIYRFFQDHNHNIDLLPHGIEKEFFLNDKKNFEKARFITVARLLDWKNIDLVIKALKIAKDKGLDFEYTIIDDGPEQKNLINLCSKLKLESHIKFTGWLNHDDIIKHLRNSNIFVLLSYPETLGRVYLEASAAGCLCIGHKDSGVDGIFTDNLNAIFCDSRTISETIQNVIINISSTEIENKIKLASSIARQLEWNIVSNKYISLFKSVSQK